MRTIIDLTDRQVEALERICRSRKLSRTELIRQAVDYYLKEHGPVRDQAFGLWKREDGVVYQRRLRKEWRR